MSTFPFSQYLIDENIPYMVIVKLREQELNVKSVLELIPGKNDEEIIEFANQNEFIIVTLDSDFGEFTLKHKLHTLGILYFRLPLTSPLIVFDNLFNYFKNYNYDPVGNFITVTESNIRIRETKK